MNKALPLPVMLIMGIAILICGTGVAGATTILDEGFETSVPPSGWTEAVLYYDGSGTGPDWTQESSGSSPSCSPHEGSYMAKFNSYSCSSGDSASLNTSEMDFDGLTAVELTFWMYHDTGLPSDDDRITIRGSIDNSAWTDLTTISRYDGSTGWKEHTVDLSTLYANQNSVWIGFIGISDYGNNMYIDKVRIGTPPCGIEVEKKVYNGTDWVDAITDAELNNTYRFRINVTSTYCNFTEVVVNDTLPDCLTYSGNAVPPPLQQSGNFTQWNFSSLNSGQTETIEFDVIASQYGYGCNVANVTANCTDEAVIYTVNDTACLTTAPAQNRFDKVWDNTMDPGSTLGDDVNDIATANSDLDGDGRPEIITGDNNGDVTVYEYNDSDNEYTQVWVNATDPWVSGSPWILSVCVCDDLDGNGRSEIIAGDDYGNVHIFEWDGTNNNYTLVATHDVGGAINDICCADIDGDNEPELGIATGDGYAYIYSFTGGWTWPWNQEFGYNAGSAVFSVLCSCDLDNNGDNEFIFGIHHDEIFIYEGTATNTYTHRWNQQLSTGWDNPYAMACCNMDQDVNGYQELYVGDDDGQLFVVTNTGNLGACSGSLIQDYPDAINGMCCGNEDNDTMNDLYLAMDDDNVHDLEFFGTNVSAYSHYKESIIGDDLNPGYNDAKAVHCTDLDGDGKREVITGYEGSSGDAMLFVLEQKMTCLDIQKTVYDPATGRWVDNSISGTKGETYRFRISITSNCCDFTDVTVNDTLSSSLQYANAATPPPSQQSGNNVSWTFNKLNKSETKTIEFNATVIECGYDCNLANVTAYCADTGNWSSIEDTACIDTPCPDLIVTTITPNYDCPDIGWLKQFFGPEPGPGARTQCNNISARIEENGWVDVTNSFNVSFKVNDVEICSKQVTGGITAGGFVHVHCDCNFTPFAGTRYNLSVTADALGEIKEKKEGNNVSWLNRTAIVNGYKGDGWQSPDKNLTNVQCHDKDTINLVYSIGNSYYQTGHNTPWTIYMADWTTSDLPIPGGASIEKARLYVYYCWDKSSNETVYENFTLNINGDNITRDAVYTDRKGWHTNDRPYGMVAYNVTDKFEAGNSVTLYNNETTYPDHVAISGMLMIVVYKDSGEPERVICIDEGYDLLYAKKSHGVSSEEATTYASFGPLSLDGDETATLVTVAPHADDGDDMNRLYFNDGEWHGVWDSFVGATNLSINETDVTAHLSTDNIAAFQSHIPSFPPEGDNMGACNAILILRKPTGGLELEFGDAPDPTYPSVLAPSDGSRHNQSDWECLGLASIGDWKDYEPDANVPNADLLDDGLVTNAITVGNAAETVTFEVSDLMAPSSGLYVNILIDLNGNGVWGPGEHAVVNQFIPAGPLEQTVVSTPFSTVGAVPGKTWLRMTLTRHQIPNAQWDGTMAGTGLGWDRFEFGETEDWEIDMLPDGEPPEVPAMTPIGFVLVMFSLFGLVVFATREVNKHK